MFGIRVAPKSLAAPAILFALTWLVFFSLQDYGPESAIRRFHHAVETRDDPQLQQVCMQRIDSPGVFELKSRVFEVLARGGHYRVGRMDRRGREVLAAVTYTDANGRLLGILVWVVEKSGSAWKVNADVTLTVFHDAMGL